VTTSIAQQYECIDTKGEVGETRKILEFISGFTEQIGVDIGELRDLSEGLSANNKINYRKSSITLVVIKKYGSPANAKYYKELIVALKQTEKPFRLVVTVRGKSDSPAVQELLKSVPPTWISRVRVYDEQDGRRDLRVDITYLDLLIAIRRQLVVMDPITASPFNCCKRYTYIGKQLVKKYRPELAYREIFLILPLSRPRSRMRLQIGGLRVLQSVGLRPRLFQEIDFRDRTTKSKLSSRSKK